MAPTGQLLDNGWIDRGGVGDHLARRHLQHRQGSVEEPTGCGRITAGGDQHLDDLPVLIDGPVHLPPDTVDLHVRLVHQPTIARPAASKPGGVDQQRRARLYPSVDGDVVDLNPAFDE